jgi:uncharacterized protein
MRQTRKEAPHPAFVRLDPAHYRRTPWKNGGGVTIDIAGAHRPGADPTGWDGMIWRFGRTRIERPGPFSDLAGFDRLLAVIDGRGLVLHPKGRPPLDVGEPFRPVRFAGEWPIESELIAGPVGVLNLLADRNRYAIDLFFPATGTTAALPAGHIIVLALGAASIVLGERAVELAADAAVSCDSAAPLAMSVLHGRVAAASLSLRQ